MHSEAATFTLYLDLVPGETADLETVSRASLAFAAAVKEAAFVLDPSLTIRIGVVGESEGSLSINAILRPVGKFAAKQKPVLTAVFIASLSWFIGYTVDIAADQAGLEATILDTARKIGIEISDEDGMTDEDIKRIAEKLIDLQKREQRNIYVQRFYQELEQDEAIKGVGIGSNHGERPEYIVPREEFSLRGRGVSPTPEAQRRYREDITRLTLIRPYLAEDSDHVWSFLSPEGQISAYVQDKAFLHDLLSGRLKVPMISGLTMDVKISTQERLQNGVWVVQRRDILEVRRARLPPHQYKF